MEKGPMTNPIMLNQETIEFNIALAPCIYSTKHNYEFIDDPTKKRGME